MKINFNHFCIHIITLQLAKIVESQMTFIFNQLHYIVWQQWLSDNTDPQRVVTKSSYSKLMDDWNIECAQYFNAYKEDGVLPNPFNQKYEYVMEMLETAVLVKLRDAMRDVMFNPDEPLKDMNVSNMFLTKDISDMIIDRFKYHINNKNLF